MLWLKALHVVAIISWMAGLLYVYRLFVYHAMETEPAVRERFQLMERRLLNAITLPAAVVSVLSGGAMLALTPYYLSQPYMHAKLALVTGLIAVTALAAKYRRELVASPTARPHRFFRVMNEVPTLLMIGIVILIIVRPWARP